MQVFDDPTIHNNPKKTNHKLHTAINQLGGLPPGLPMGPPPQRLQQHPMPEETKKWKNTRETQNFKYRQVASKPSSKLGEMKESPNMENKPSPINKYTPNHMLSFSKQIGANNSRSK